jgi:hypothetical protein
MSTEISPDKQELMRQAIDIMERMLDGCVMIFNEIKEHSQAPIGIKSAAESASDAITRGRLVLDAVIDSTHATKH